MRAYRILPSGAVLVMKGEAESTSEGIDQDVEPPFVSVIIPTYHDWERLRGTLSALEQQSYPSDRLEVIVVNNDPSDKPLAPTELADGWVIVDEGKPGSYAARNRGLHLARGQVVAFTDSDCLPDEHWIERGVSHLRRGAERVAGRVALFYGGERLNCVEKYEKACAFPQERYASEGISVTANFITWRRHFVDVGFFDDSLFSGGDTEWGRRASAAGISIIYAPDVLVKHPARNKLSGLLTKRRRLAAAALSVKKPVGRRALLISLIRGVLPPLVHHKALNRREDLSWDEKFAAIVIIYFLKIYGTWHRIKLLSGFSKPERR